MIVITLEKKIKEDYKLTIREASIPKIIKIIKEVMEILEEGFLGTRNTKIFSKIFYNILNNAQKGVWFTVVSELGEDIKKYLNSGELGQIRAVSL
jgi:hypothetical protein